MESTQNFTLNLISGILKKKQAFSDAACIRTHEYMFPLLTQKLWYLHKLFKMFDKDNSEFHISLANCNNKKIN